jgi:hypothetical protein
MKVLKSILVCLIFLMTHGRPMAAFVNQPWVTGGEEKAVICCD